MPPSVRLRISRWPSCSTADAAADAALLPMLDAHVIETAQLPLVHYPFDRLLIAQAWVEGLMTVSSDGHWPGYEVSLHRV
jgi:PIN domain nuclease of toxin-antitoxin system